MHKGCVIHMPRAIALLVGRSCRSCSVPLNPTSLRAYPALARVPTPLRSLFHKTSPPTRELLHQRSHPAIPEHSHHSQHTIPQTTHHGQQQQRLRPRHHEQRQRQRPPSHTTTTRRCSTAQSRQYRAIFSHGSFENPKTQHRHIGQQGPSSGVATSYAR